LRRACSAAVTGLLVIAAALPAALLTGPAPAAASPVSTVSPASQASSARAGQSGGPVSVAITGLSPQWASPGKTITVTGTVTNKTRQAISHLTVQLWSGSSPITDPATMLADLTSQTGALGDNQLTRRSHQLAAALPPGAADAWQISVPAAELGMTRFGVYPLTAEVSSTLGSATAYANTFLPYVPPKRGRHASASPARQQIAWVWPLIDQPLIALPGQSVCTGQPAQALAAAHALGASLATGGRLGGLLSAGASYTSHDQLTWAIDPALLWDAARIGKCAAVWPAQARAANDWLTRVRTATRRQPLFVTPYANVNLALIRQRHEVDVSSAFQAGRTVASQILHRDVAPAASSTPSGTQPQAASIAWPPGGIASSDTLQSLLPNSNIETVLLHSSAVPGAPSSAFLAPAVASYLRVLLYSDALSSVLGAASPTAGSQFAAAQGFLAETAVLAGQHHGQPIVVAPPQSWQATPSLAAAVLRETATAPWLRPVSLTSLARGAKKSLQLPANGAGPAGFNGKVLRQLTLVRQNITQLQSIEAPNGPASDGLRPALAALESSAWHHLPRRVQLARVAKLQGYVISQQKTVVIGVYPRVTLGGLKGTVPVLIDNGLGYPIRVRLKLTYTQPPGGASLDVQQQPGGAVLVQKHQRLVVKLHVHATQVGSTTIYLRLYSTGRNGAPLPYATATVTVQATQFGTVAMIILAAALGVFMIGSAARAIRRRPAPPDNFPDGGQGDPDGPHGGQQEAEPDSVVPERAELGTAGTSGL
jgi:hypothetical protein